jgi:hypothetical protein
LPGVCEIASDTVVLAHLRRASTAGIGQKPSDLCAVHSCRSCHDVIDGRDNRSVLVGKEIDSYLLDALCRTLSRVGEILSVGDSAAGFGAKGCTADDGLDRAECRLGGFCVCLGDSDE